MVKVLFTDDTGDLHAFVKLDTAPTEYKVPILNPASHLPRPPWLANNLPIIGFQVFKRIGMLDGVVIYVHDRTEDLMGQSYGKQPSEYDHGKEETRQGEAGEGGEPFDQGAGI